MVFSVVCGCVLCVVLCVCVGVVWVVSVCACGVVVRVCVWCCMARGIHPVCRFKTPPCVRSGRLRVYRQRAHMCSTCGPVAGTHGDVLTVHTEAF